MNCQKCGGLVYHDTMFENESFIDLSCLMCGKRWHIRLDHVVARLVLRKYG